MKTGLTKRIIAIALAIALPASGAVAAWVYMQTVQTQAVKEFDSGWIEIADKRGQNFTITHNLNSTDVQIDVTGSVEANGSIHQKYLGLVAAIPGFNRTYESDEGGVGIAVIQISDGGFAILGHTTSPYGYLILVKTDGNGVIEWNRTFGKADLEYVSSPMVQTPDGGFVIGGFVGDMGHRYMLLSKMDAGGNMSWQKTYETEGCDDMARGVFPNADGGYVIVGQTVYPRTDTGEGGGSSLILVKTDADGNQLSRKVCAVAMPLSVTQTRDGGYAMTVFRNNLAKTDDEGNLLWQKTLLNNTETKTYSSFFSQESLVQTVDGGYLVVGDLVTSYYASRETLARALVIRTDANGNVLWQKTVGKEGDAARCVIQTADGGYAIAGNTKGYDAMLFVKTDADGNLQWRKTNRGEYGGGGESVIQTGDGAYVVVGYTRNNTVFIYSLLLVKTDVEGEFGLAMKNSTPNALTFYRGRDDVDWNYVRVRVWKDD